MAMRNRALASALAVGCLLSAACDPSSPPTKLDVPRAHAWVKVGEAAVSDVVASGSIDDAHIVITSRGLSLVNGVEVPIQGRQRQLVGDGVTVDGGAIFGLASSDDSCQVGQVSMLGHALHVEPRSISGCGGHGGQGGTRLHSVRDWNKDGVPDYVIVWRSVVSRDVALHVVSGSSNDVVVSVNCRGGPRDYAADLEVVSGPGGGVRLAVGSPTDSSLDIYSEMLELERTLKAPGVEGFGSFLCASAAGDVLLAGAPDASHPNAIIGQGVMIEKAMPDSDERFSVSWGCVQAMSTSDWSVLWRCYGGRDYEFFGAGVVVEGELDRCLVGAAGSGGRMAIVDLQSGAVTESVSVPARGGVYRWMRDRECVIVVGEDEQLLWAPAKL